MPPPWLSAALRTYNSNFDRRPVPTLIVTNGVLNTIADVLAQGTAMASHDVSKSPRPSYDLERTLRFAAWGMALGPVIGRWLRFLERRIPMKPGSPNANIQLVKRVVADQVLLAPLGMVAFIAAMGFMEGKSTEQVGQKFQDMYITAMVANWKVWPIIQAVNFKLMPIQYRVPFQTTCGIGWNLYLSMLNAAKPPDAPVSQAGL